MILALFPHFLSWRRRGFYAETVGVIRESWECLEYGVMNGNETFSEQRVPRHASEKLYLNGRRAFGFGTAYSRGEKMRADVVIHGRLYHVRIDAHRERERESPSLKQNGQMRRRPAPSLVSGGCNKDTATMLCNSS